MNPETFRALGTALSPLSIVLFAFEMCSLDSMYYHGLMEGSKFEWRSVYACIKLVASIVVPALFAAYGFWAIAALDIISVIVIIREQNAVNRKKEGYIDV